MNLYFLLFLFVSGRLLWAAPAQASTITVNTTSDELNSDGDCSLREAIRATNMDSPIDACPAGSGADTIILPSGIYTLTVVGSGENAALTGDFDITDNLIITGAGSVNTLIDGNRNILKDRVFQLIGSITVSLSGVTIRNGNAGPGDGGGIHNADGKLTLDNVTLDSNRANGTSGGGGIYSNSSLILNKVVISNNTAAKDGGGIYSSGTLALTQVTVSGNTANSIFGGGIYSSGILTLTHSTIVSNQASFGGGIYSSEMLTLVSSTLNNNSAPFGGGVYSNGRAAFTGVTFSGNTGDNGSVVFNGSEGKMTLTNSTVVTNTSLFGGGNIFSYGDLTLINCIVSNNHNYAIISTGGTMRVTNSSVISNAIGVAISISSSTVKLTNSTVSNNSGGGIFNSGVLVVENSTVSGNRATDWIYAGGIANTSQMTLINSTISNNSSTEDGGGIRNGAGGVVNLSNTTIANNIADSDSNGTGDGGGIYNASDFGGLAQVNLRNSIIAGNTDPGEQAPDCSGTLNSEDYNLIQNTAGCVITGTSTHNQIGLNPRLSPLQNNGGPTFSRALMAGSPAIDAGNPAGCTDNLGNILVTDQRGFFRTVDGDDNGSAGCDIGAYEFRSILFVPSEIHLPAILR